MEKQVPVRVLNQQTSAVLGEVERGASITVTRGGRPVARIVPVAPVAPGLPRLIDEGIVVPATEKGPIVIPPATGRPGVDVGAAIARDRANGRW